jgi:hypothetical protein
LGNGWEQMLLILEEPLFNRTNERNQNPHQGRRRPFCFALGGGNGWRNIALYLREEGWLGNSKGVFYQSIQSNNTND